MIPTDRPLRVVHIGTADRVGGAARAQWRMHEALLRAGVDSRILCGFKSVGDEDDRVAQVPAMASLPAKAIRKAAHKLERLTGREYHLLPWGNRFLNHPWIRRTDVIHLHNLHGGYFPIKLLPRLARVAPLVWSAHDLWPTTGHCYFPQMTSCRCWTGESACIDPAQDDWYPLKRDTSRWLWQQKRRLVAESRPTFVAQSSFTEHWLRDAPITESQQVARVPYALETEAFRPTPRKEARAALDIPDDRPVVMFSAVSLSHPRKGGGDVIEAARAAAERRPGGLTLLAVGGGSDGLEALRDRPNLRLITLGQVDDDTRLALAYSAADVFLGASKVETFGQVFSEAASCGTPGVAYQTSGVADAIRDGKTGLLVPTGEADALAAALESLLTDDARRSAMSLHARDVCVREYAYPVVAQQLVEMYAGRLRAFASSGHGTTGGGDG